MQTTMRRVIEILLVEDNPADIDLTREGLSLGKISNNLHVVTDGVAALEFLRRDAEYAGAPRPDLVLLDLNLPKLDGRAVLRSIKEDPELCTIPVVIMTSSKAETDILKSYELQANCYVQKPIDFRQFVRIVRSIEDFWFEVVRMPRTSPRI